MAWSKFKYSYVGGRDDLGYRPYLEVEVIGSSGKRAAMFAIIDSGCQTTMINKGMGPLLGVDFSKCKRILVGGVGGEGGYGYLTEVALEFRDFPGVSFVTPVTFSDIPAEMLLGQDNFFRNFDIMFCGKEQEFQLNPIKKIKGAQ